MEAITTKENKEKSSIANGETAAQLIAGFEEISLSESQTNEEKMSATDNLLVELGIADIDLSLPSVSTIKNLPQNQPQYSIGNTLDWLADEANAFSSDVVDDILKFDTQANQNQVVSNNNKINLLD